MTFNAAGKRCARLVKLIALGRKIKVPLTSQFKGYDAAACSLKHVAYLKRHAYTYYTRGRNVTQTVNII